MTADAGPPALTALEAAGLSNRERPHEIKLARRTAERIEGDILRSRLPSGTIWASELELRDRYTVSRAVLREAIRLVEHHGLAIMRRGPYGGLVLKAPDSSALTRAAVVYLEYVGTSVEDLLAVRSLLEPVAARLAAQNLTERHIDVLRSTLETERSYGALAPSRRQLFHTSIGHIGGNRVLGLFIDVLTRLTTRYASIPLPLNERAAKRLSTASDHAHGRIAEAIIAGNAMLAEHRCLTHLNAMREWLLSIRQDPIERRRVYASDASGGGGKEKLAEAVARRLMSDIASSEVAVGEIYSSETELLSRLDVSRAVFREAIRLLEYHSVARMRRGPHGGLVVTSPDPSACVDAMAVYLDYQKVAAEELRVVREAIELGSLELLTHREDDPALVPHLRSAHKLNSETPADEIADLSHDFHIRLAELTGNPVLTLFLRILLAVWNRHYPGPSGEPSRDAPLAGVVIHTHDRILDAITDGDLPLARHRMHRHLEALDEWWQ